MLQNLSKISQSASVNLALQVDWKFTVFEEKFNVW